MGVPYDVVPMEFLTLGVVHTESPAIQSASQSLMKGGEDVRSGKRAVHSARQVDRESCSAVTQATGSVCGVVTTPHILWGTHARGLPSPLSL